MKKLFFLASALLCGVISASAVDYLVQTGKEGDGKWTEDAIKALKVTTDKVIDLSKGGTLPTTGEIWFAAGTYDFTAQYAITQGAKLYGGFAGTETKTPTRALKASNKPYDFTNPTIFNVKQPETGNKVKILPEQVNGLVLDGICIQNSVGTGKAGVCRLASGSKVFNCTFKNCSSDNQGGVFMLYNATATIGGCLFEGNYAKQGGVIHIGSGSGTSNYIVTIDTCDFLNNYISRGGNAGGAINKQNDGETLLISNCNFIGNDAPSNGATFSINGISTTTISNSLITGSKTKTAIYVPGSLNLYYCTVVENAAGAIYVTNVNTTNAVVNIKNNVFWATKAAAANCGLGSAKGTATNNASLQNWTGSTNLSVADNIKLDSVNTGNEGKLYPVFADPENGDFNIGKGSALIGKGVAIDGITTDIEGVTRTSLDLGAYAYIEGKVPTAVENTEKAPLDIQAALQAGEVYNLLGQRVGELQAGNIYIVGGQKVLMQ